MYDTYALDSRILFFDETKAVHLRRIDYKTETFFTRSSKVYNESQVEEMKQELSHVLLEKERDVYLSLYEKNPHPIYFRLIEKEYELLRREELYYGMYLKIRVEIYEPKRYGFIAAFNRGKADVESLKQELSYFEENKKGFFAYRRHKRLKDAYQKAIQQNEELFNRQIQDYEAWLQKQFVVLKLPPELLSKFKDSFLIACKYDLNFSFIIMESLVEKIIQFLKMAKAIQEKNGYEQAIIRSIPKFSAHIEKQIDILHQQSYDYLQEEEYDTSINTALEAIHEKVFADAASEER